MQSGSQSRESHATSLRSERVAKESLAGTANPKSSSPSRPGRTPTPQMRAEFPQSRRQGSETWEFLAIDIESPYLDTSANLTAGQAEWRDYLARYLDGTPAGDWSAVLRVNLG